MDTQSKTGISSWVEQGTDEITKIVETFSDERRVIVAGDFNVGPEIPPNVTAVQPGENDTFYPLVTNELAHPYL